MSKSRNTQQIVEIKTNQIRRMGCFAYRRKNEQEIRQRALSRERERIEEKKTVKTKQNKNMKQLCSNYLCIDFLVNR